MHIQKLCECMGYYSCMYIYREVQEQERNMYVERKGRKRTSHSSLPVFHKFSHTFIISFITEELRYNRNHVIINGCNHYLQAFLLPTRSLLLRTAHQAQHTENDKHRSCLLIDWAYCSTYQRSLCEFKQLQLLTGQ